MRRRNDSLNVQRKKLYDLWYRISNIINEGFAGAIREIEETNIRQMHSRSGRLVGRVEEVNLGRAARFLPADPEDGKPPTAPAFEVATKGGPEKA